MATTKQPQGYLGMTFVGLYSDGRQWKWTDGTEVNYNNWEADEPNYDGVTSKQLGVEMITDMITDPHASFFFAGGWNEPMKAKCERTSARNLLRSCKLV